MILCSIQNKSSLLSSASVCSWHVLKCRAFSSLMFFSRGGGGELDLSLVRGCRPDLETLTLFTVKSSWKSRKTIPRLWFSEWNATHFIVKMRDFLDPVYKKASKIWSLNLRPCLWADGRKSHTLHTSPYSLCMGAPPLPRGVLLKSCLYWIYQCIGSVDISFEAKFRRSLSSAEF